MKNLASHVPGKHLTRKVQEMAWPFTNPMDNGEARPLHFEDQQMQGCQICEPENTAAYLAKYWCYAENGEKWVQLVQSTILTPDTHGVSMGLTHT